MLCGNELSASVRTPVFRKLRLITYDDGRFATMVQTRFISTRYVEDHFSSVALSQVHATQTNAVFAVN